MSTGNWSPTDFNWPMPGEYGAYPAYPNPDWQITNRDIQFTTEDPAIISQFMDVFNNDYQRGKDYSPYW